MDISFVTESGKFNYRVCAVVISDGRILAMHDGKAPYYYLPGGRVRMGETAEQALVREIREEMGVTAGIVRPLWLGQSFFTEDVDGLAYHELCLYFLTDITETELPTGDRFEVKEGNRTNSFEWLPFERLQDAYFYPMFLKKEIFALPDTFTIRTDIE